MQLSILIPVYNVEKTLRAAIESVTSQKIQDMEIICVDDCSTDDSLQILEALAQEDSRIRILHMEKNVGLGLVRKRAAEISQGDYIMFLDSDDALEPDVCGKLLKEIQERKLDVLHFETTVHPTWNMDADRVAGLKKMLKPYDGELNRKDLYNACFVEKKFGFNIWNKIYKGDIIRKAYKSFPEERVYMAEDMLAAMMILYYAKRYGSTKTKSYIYNYGDGVTGEKKITLDLMKKRSLMGDVIKAIDRFLEEQDAVEQCRDARNVAAESCIEGVIWPWLRELGEEDAPEAFSEIRQHYAPGDIGAYCKEHCEAWHVTWKDLAARMGSNIGCMQQKKIRTIAAYYYRAHNGGIERVMTKLLAEWIQMGYRVILVTDDAATVEDYDYPDEVVRLQLYADPENRSASERYANWERYIQEYEIDAVVYHPHLSFDLLTDLMTIKLAGAAFMVHIHSSFAHCYRDGHTIYEKISEEVGYAYQLADAVITLSEVEKYWWGCWNPNVFKTINPIDVDYHNVIPRTEKNHDIVWVGWINWEKQSVLALEVMGEILEEVPDAHLHIVGAFANDEIKEAVNQTVQRLNLGQHVTFHGFHKEPWKFYEMCSVQLMTSAYEGMPLVLIEGKTMGLPCVAFDLLNVDMFRDGKGMIKVPQKDSRAMAAATIRLLKDDVLWRKLSQEARESAEPICLFDQKKRWTGIFAHVENKEMVESNPIANAAVRMLANDMIEGYMRTSAIIAETAVTSVVTVTKTAPVNIYSISMGEVEPGVYVRRVGRSMAKAIDALHYFTNRTWFGRNLKRVLKNIARFIRKL